MPRTWPSIRRRRFSTSSFFSGLICMRSFLHRVAFLFERRNYLRTLDLTVVVSDNRPADFNVTNGDAFYLFQCVLYSFHAVFAAHAGDRVGYFVHHDGNGSLFRSEERRVGEDSWWALVWRRY